MFTFSGSLVQLNFNKEKYRKRLDEILKRQVRNAAREWLRAVIPNVPVWTGTARGTLLPLSRILRVANRISPVHFKRDFGPSIGENFGAFSFLDGTNGQYGFQYQIFLDYFQENEFSPAPAKYKLKNPTPWHALRSGDAAYKKYMADILPQRLPNPAECLEIGSKITIG